MLGKRLYWPTCTRRGAGPHVISRGLHRSGGTRDSTRVARGAPSEPKRQPAGAEGKGTLRPINKQQGTGERPPLGHKRRRPRHGCEAHTHTVRSRGASAARQRALRSTPVPHLGLQDGQAMAMYVIPDPTNAEPSATGRRDPGGGPRTRGCRSSRRAGEAAGREQSHTERAARPLRPGQRTRSERDTGLTVSTAVPWRVGSGGFFEMRLSATPGVRPGKGRRRT